MSRDDAETAAVIGDILLEAGNDVTIKGRKLILGHEMTFSIDDDEVVIEHERTPGGVKLLLESVRLGRKVKIRGKLYDVHDLDVWGNEEEGFEINDVYPSRGKIEIPTDAKDADIVRMLKDEGFLKDTVKFSDVEIEGDEYELYIRDSKTSEPVFELRPG
jgi:hypothetical protein